MSDIPRTTAVGMINAIGNAYTALKAAGLSFLSKYGITLSALMKTQSVKIQEVVALLNNIEKSLDNTARNIRFMNQSDAKTQRIVAEYQATRAEYELLKKVCNIFTRLAGYDLYSGSDMGAFPLIPIAIAAAVITLPFIIWQMGKYQLAAAKKIEAESNTKAIVAKTIPYLGIGAVAAASYYAYDRYSKR